MIGYLAVEAFEPLGYVGGVLVVDRFGLPVEFRHTLPVRPTKLQRALYGDALDRYMRTAVIALRLIEGLEHPPVVVLGADPILVADVEPPVVHAAVSGVEPIGVVGDVEPFEGGSEGFLLQLRAGEAPLRVVTTAPVHRYRELAHVVGEAAETMDLFEPLARVAAGVALVAAGDVAA